MALVCVQVSTVGNARTVHKDLIQSHFRENEPSPAEGRRFTQCIDHYLKEKKHQKEIHAFKCDFKLHLSCESSKSILHVFFPL